MRMREGNFAADIDKAMDIHTQQFRGYAIRYSFAASRPETILEEDGTLYTSLEAAWSQAEQRLAVIIRERSGPGRNLRLVAA